MCVDGLPSSWVVTKEMIDSWKDSKEVIDSQGPKQFRKRAVLCI